MRVPQVDPSVDPDLARTSLGIQHAAETLEATLIHDDRKPALHEDVDALGPAARPWLAAFFDPTRRGGGMD